MADTKTVKLEREYIIPLRKFWLRAPEYERTGKAVKAIKKFIAKHMKVEERDVDKVKLDVYFNNEVWYRGKASPPAKVKVKAMKYDDGTVFVTFAETPQHVKFNISKNERRHQKSDVKAPAEEKKEEKTEEQKKDEKEKESSTADQNAKDAKHDASVQKNIGKPQKVIHPPRMALQK